MPTEVLHGVPFTKMTGSGNDFVFFDAREVELERVSSPEVIARICNRHNGIGADGVVVLEASRDASGVVIHYFNSDGTPADLCGNATLCSTALSASLGIAAAAGMRLTTGAGEITSRVSSVAGTDLPEIDFQPVTDIRPDMPIALGPGEQRIGFALAGIPHLVIFCTDADEIALSARAPGLRRHAATGSRGANVNWVSRLPDGRWRYRTFERGVEGETLACGTGAVATAILLSAWGIATGDLVTILTSSGRELEVRLRPVGAQASATGNGFRPSLRGEGRVVFHGTIASI
jgi:diaminopimelate epimerase